MTVGDVLVDFVLRIWCVGMLIANDEVAEAQEIRHISGSDRDGETVRVLAIPKQNVEYDLLSRGVELVRGVVHGDGFPLNNVPHY